MLLGIISNIGVLAAAAVTMLILSSRFKISTDQMQWHVVLGLVFGVICLIVVKIPIATPLGATFDSRGGPVVLAGVFGGPVAALITATMGAVARYEVGGPAVWGGVVSFYVYAGVGLLARMYFRKQGTTIPKIDKLILLSIVASVLVTPCFFIAMPFETAVTIIQNFWLFMLIGNVFGILVMGLIYGEMMMIAEQRTALAAANEKAKESMAAKDRFMSAVSHDLRTPLNAIIGTIQLLGHERLSDNGKRNLIVAEKSSHFLVDLVDQIISYAKKSADHTKVSTDFSVHQMLDGMKSIFSPIADNHDVSLETDITLPETSFFKGDPERLRQVLFNVVGNAVKFSPGGTVKIEAHADQDNAGIITFSVSDTGPGIPKEDQNRIFEPFVRLNGIEGPEGSGLGLSITTDLLNELNTTLELDSVEGLGSRFFFSIEMEEVPGALVPSVSMDPEEIAAEPRSKTGLKLLAVDDNEINRELLQQGLRNFGHVVDLAESGKQAIELLSQSPDAYAAVLMDIQMPEMNGDDASRIIRETIADVDALPIIAVTANAFAEQKQQYLDAGMNTVVTKPVDFDRLNKLLFTICLGDEKLIAAEDGAPSAAAGTILINSERLTEVAALMKSTDIEEIIRNVMSRFESAMGDLEGTTLSPKLKAEICHELKGLSANFGFVNLSEASASLEDTLKAGRPATVAMQELRNVLESSRRHAKKLKPAV